MPKSYLSSEPAMMRAVLNRFDPYLQVSNRLQSLQLTGHFTDKVDLIVSGGTFSFYPKHYQTAFLRGIFNALNFPLPASRSLSEAQKLNETALNRCIGLSLETRPDLVSEAEIKRMRRLGCTRVEIGVQSLQNDILARSKRGHTTAEVKRAFRLLKDAALKVNAHMMPNLPGATPEGDLRDMRELFENADYRPDWLKVYPCMVVPWSALEKMYRQGQYQSYDDETLINLLVEMHRIWPEYVRVTRVYRDIPAGMIVSGSKYSNLRQIVETRLAKEGIYPREIRSREIRDLPIDPDNLEMNTRQYQASGGEEFFITFEDRRLDKLCALLRLRFSACSLEGRRHFIGELEGAALIRELHTYGEQVAISSRQAEASQHLGLGKKLMAEAERLARSAGYKKIAVISGIGVREYYRKLGYSQSGTYMVKALTV
jgi:elongator complex protein 3